MDTEILVNPSISQHIFTNRLLQQAPNWSPSCLLYYLVTPLPNLAFFLRENDSNWRANGTDPVQREAM